MEIRDPIHGTIEINKSETKIIDHPIFQRLRSIKQLGFAEFSFPGATHNRYLHSLGVMHLAGIVFDRIFKDYDFKTSDIKSRFRQVVRLGGLLHDIGHGPLSHTIESVMPKVSSLNIKVYEKFQKGSQFKDPQRSASHEDYTIKIITDSDLASLIESEFQDISTYNLACLIDKNLPLEDGFYIYEGIDFRIILSQIVSSEIDADRMDYLERDSYFCGANYGKVELSWLVSNLTYYKTNETLYLALNRRALYAFDDFLLSRHHMHLMVYFHHKCLIYEELLMRYLYSEDCEFYLSSDIEEYVKYTDYYLYEHLNYSKNEWAQRLAKKDPYKMLFEYHFVGENDRCVDMKKIIEERGVDVILANSSTRLSKYHTLSFQEQSFSIYVVDEYDYKTRPYPIEKSTEIFKKYEEVRRIERLYVAPESFQEAQKIIKSQNL